MGAQPNYLPVIPDWEINISIPEIKNSLSVANAFVELWDKKSLLRQERVYIIYLDLNHRPIRHELLNIGKRSETMFDQATAIEYAFECRAAYVLLAHNHTSGNCNPSRDDFALTAEFKDTLNRLGMHLADHIIITPTKHYSFQDNGYLK